MHGTSPVEDRNCQFKDRSIDNIQNKLLYREKTITNIKSIKENQYTIKMFTIYN